MVPVLYTRLGTLPILKGQMEKTHNPGTMRKSTQDLAMEVKNQPQGEHPLSIHLKKKKKNHKSTTPKDQIASKQVKLTYVASKQKLSGTWVRKTQPILRRIINHSQSLKSECVYSLQIRILKS